jgi:hypothetical protein
MDADMSVVDVVEGIKQLRQNGIPLNKKKIKQSHPQLIRNALCYFPSWDHAVQSTNA